MSTHRKKKPVEFHFVDMNDPDRYKKLKVTRACDFCRRRKSKCDIGIPGSGTCSNCQKHQMVCIFSPVTTNRGNEVIRLEEPLFNTLDQFLFRFPLLLIKDGQVGYETNPIDLPPVLNRQPTKPNNNSEPSISLESKLFKLYFDNVHPAYPVLLKQSILNIHSQDRFLLCRGLRYAIMALACHYFPTYTLPTSLPTSTYFYDIARHEVSSLTPRLDTVQTLLLLYKHDEIHTSSKHGIYYLERAQEMIGQIQSLIPQHQEMINRARWVLFGSIGFSNLSDLSFNKLYTKISLPLELPQALSEEELDENETCSAQHHLNRFSQIANLSVLYSHTVQSMITGSTGHLICLKQFKKIRQHWHDSLHPITQSRLVSLCPTDEEEVDIMILYSAILYDMLYLLLLSHYHLETEFDRVETAYRLQRMVHTLVTRSCFTGAIQSTRMSNFALMLCLQVNMSREDDKIDYEFIQQIRQSIKYTKLDTRIDEQLLELYNFLTGQNKVSPPQIQPQTPLDYFSLIPQQFQNSTSTSPVDNMTNTPGLWSTTTNGGLITPIREDTGNNHRVTSEWILEQQRQQDEQFQSYQLQQLPQYQPTVISTYNNNNTTTNINYNSSSNNTPLTTTPSYLNTNTEDYFYLNPGHWSPTLDHLNQNTSYLKLHNHDHQHNTFTLHQPPPPPPTI
ncbi:hypothetical protein BDF21DRAFT_406600 [Thamnidium elegans]|nr:hypothetical protein BDF21DRAFT_406600 [Thamnidium elegans]